MLQKIKLRLFGIKQKPKNVDPDKSINPQWISSSFVPKEFEQAFPKWDKEKFKNIKN